MFFCPVSSLDTLQTLVENRAYQDIPDRLKSVVSLSFYFEPFHVPQITSLVNQTNDLKKQLERAISTDIRGFIIFDNN